MFNKVTMVGNLTRDCELRYTPNGLAIAKSSIATSHKYKAANGEQKDEVCFLEFTIMGRIAEVANQYLRKGSRVLLEGRLVLEQWTDNNGQNRSKHSLRVEEMKMLDNKPQEQTTAQPQQQQQPSYAQPQPQSQERPPSLMDGADDDEEIPF